MFSRPRIEYQLLVNLGSHLSPWAWFLQFSDENNGLSIWNVLGRHMWYVCGSPGIMPSTEVGAQLVVATIPT